MVCTKKLTSVIARGISRSIHKTNFHPVLYFSVLFLCLVQTILTFLSPQCILYVILRWFDLSTSIDSKILLYFLAGPCILSAFLLLLQNYWAACSDRMETKIPQHYAIKIATTISFIISYAFCLPLIRCAVTAMASPQAGNQGLGVVILLLFLVIIYPYSMFLLTDLSPHNNKIYAVVSLPNCFTLCSLYRPIAALMVSTEKSQYVIIPASFLFISLIIGVIKWPLITWRYNKISQGFIACIIWAILNRIIELISGVEVSVLSCFIGTPIFILFFQWLAHKRLISIISKEQNTVLKLKTLYFLLVNRRDCEAELNIFIIEHYRTCSSPVCACRKIMESLQKQKTANQFSYKPEEKSKIVERSTFSLLAKIRDSKESKHDTKDEQKTDDSERLSQERKREEVFWFQLLHSLQNSRFEMSNLDKLSATEKISSFGKARQTVLDEVEILHYQLGQQYQSLKCLWFSEQIYSKNLFSIFYLVRYLIEIFSQEQTLQKNLKQDGSNRYAIHFYTLQTQLIRFKELLLKTTVRVYSFWSELVTQKPDQKKLLRELREVVKGRQEISAVRKETFNRVGQDVSESRNGEYSWDLKTRLILENIFSCFSTVLRLNTESDPYVLNQKELKVFLDNKQRTLEKNLEFYDYKANTGMAVVNIQEGAQFGNVVNSNKRFWDMIGTQKFKQLNVNHFFITEMQEYHRQKMLNFLQQNKHCLSFRHGFIINTHKQILEVEISIQTLPQLSEGFFAAVFMQEVRSSRPIFLLDATSRVLSFNDRFKRDFLADRKLKEFDETITKEVVSHLLEYKQAKANLQGEELSLKLVHSVSGETTLLYCEIFRQWETAPAIEVLEYTATQSFCLGKQKNESTGMMDEARGGKKHKQQESKKQSQKRQKEKEREFEEQQEMLHIFNSLANEKRSQKLRYWEISIHILLIMAFLLSVISSGFGQFKVNNYMATYYSYSNITNLIQHSSEIIYLSRKLNVYSFHNRTEESQQILQRLRALNQLISNERQFVGIGDWKTSLPSYETSRDGRVQQSVLSFEMIVQKNLLAPLTTYLDAKEGWAFDYTQQAKVTPYSSSELSLLNMVENSVYTILPKLGSDFRSFVEEKWEKSIILPSTIIPFCVLLVTLAIIIKIFTVYLRIKVLQSLDSGMQLLEKLSIRFMNERMKILLNYQQTEFEDFSHKESHDLKNKDEGTELINEKNQTVDASESTTRNLETMSGDQWRIKQDKEERNKLRVEKVSKKKPALMVLLVIMPIALLGMAIVSYQVGQNFLIWGELQLQSMYNARRESILLINSYTYEFEHERAYFLGQPFSISNKFAGLLENTYNLSHQIQSGEAKQSASYKQRLNALKLMSLCQILELASTSESRKCSPSEMQTYGQKSKDQIMVLYIETARSLFASYKSQTPTTENQLKFTADDRHQQLLQMREHLISCENYIVEELFTEYKNTLQTYLIGIVIICLSLAPIMVAMKVYWLGMKRREMQQEVSIVKTIIEFISLNEILKNEPIKKLIHSRASLYRFVN